MYEVALESLISASPTPGQSMEMIMLKSFPASKGCIRVMDVTCSGNCKSINDFLIAFALGTLNNRNLIPPSHDRHLLGTNCVAVLAPLV